MRLDPEFVASMLGMLADSIIQDMEAAGIEPTNARLTRRTLKLVEAWADPPGSKHAEV